VDAMAVGWEKNEEATKEMLFEWADIIIVVEEYILNEKIPEKYKYKTKLYNIGVDRWGLALHPGLLEVCDACIERDSELYSEIKDNVSQEQLQIFNSKIEKRKNTVDKLNQRELSLSAGTFFNGMTAKQFWDILSKEDKYEIKMQMYKEKIIHDIFEFKGTNKEKNEAV
jgi:hypothetical protein